MRKIDLRDCKSGRERGRVHGESFRHEIGDLCRLRRYLACSISGFDEPGLLELAERHMPVLRDYDAALYDEVLGLAEGAGVSNADIMVLNHYTDLRDLRPDTQQDDIDREGGCTMLWSRGRGRPVFAQTWDMHATALPYVAMLRVSDASGGDGWVLSLVGCLGMAGMSASGVAAGINNLASTDAVIGVMWSAIVRKCLAQDSARDALAVLEATPFGSGHNYLVADRGEVFSVETSGTMRKRIFSGERDVYSHTNHCLDGEVAKCSRVKPGSTTYDRYTQAEALLARDDFYTAEDAWRLLSCQDGYPNSICTNVATPEAPHAAATCAAIAMDIAGGRVLACAGFPHGTEPEVLSFAGDRVDRSLSEEP